MHHKHFGGLRILSAAVCLLLAASACAPAAGVTAGDAGGAEKLPLRGMAKAAPVSDTIAPGSAAGSAAQGAPALNPAPLVSGAAGLRDLLEDVAVQSLSIPATFGITRPDAALETSYETYFITGTSDPGGPVYFDGNPIERQGASGVFGVYVRLEMGRNTFTFRQGDQTQTVAIDRVAAPGTARISAIVQSSMVPAQMHGVQAGGALTVACTAPSGASVTASFGGQTATLTQTDTAVSDGYPAAFTGKIPVGTDYEPAVTQNAGTVQYTMSYGGESKRYTSSGDVYVAGEGGRIVVEVTEYLGFIYPNIQDLSVFKETVKTGARDHIKGQNNEYYALESGGYLPKGQARILEGKNGVQNQLGGVTSASGARTETYTFTGTRRPMYVTRISEGTLYLTLYNTAGTPGINVSGSALLSGAAVSQSEGAVTYALSLRGGLWGYNVSFNGTDTVLTLRRKPTSIAGMTVVLDPGHGGTDGGALGLAGKTGPTEADVNLANAMAIRDRLTELGANVVMTRTADTYLSLDDRLRLIESSGADVFLSIHHNSIGENADANKVSGMEVYYHTGLSASFGNSMMAGLESGLGRKNRSVEQSYYRVTLMPHSPALLLELGFMSNPVEYENACSAQEMQRVAAAVADGLQRAIG